MDSPHCAAENSLADKTQTKKAFECSMCLKIFTRKSKLTEHYRIHTGEKPFECDICSMKFSRKWKLNKHIKGHSNDNPFKCEMCPKNFSEKRSLNRHMRVHTGEKPYECDVCLKKFNDQGNFHRHIRVHTGATPFQCDICERKFAYKSNLTDHHRLHTGPYKVICDICKKPVSKKYLLNHRKLHSGEKPFSCKFCHKTFTFENCLRRHIKLRHEKKPSKCDFCQQQIFSKNNLTRYMKEHTGEKPRPFQCDSCLDEFRLKIEVTNGIVIKDESSEKISETQMETYHNNKFEDVEAKVKEEDVEDIYLPTDFEVDNAFVKSDSVNHDISDHFERFIETEKIKEEDNNNEELQRLHVKVEKDDLEDTYLPTEFAVEDGFVKRDRQFEVVHNDLELHLDISEHFVKIEENLEKDSDIINSVR